MRSVLFALVAVASACATAETAAPSPTLAALQSLDEASRSLPVLPPPAGTLEAQSYLSGALAAMRAERPKHAAVFLDAILRSDHLSDRGRANIYWLAAEAHRLAGENAVMEERLGGFLVATELLEADDDLRQRAVDARAVLLARKVLKNPMLGKSPRAAIPVEDPRDANGVVAELSCGSSGKASYVEDVVATHDIDDAARRHLEERRLICTEGGAPLVLWFSVMDAL